MSGRRQPRRIIVTLTAEEHDILKADAERDMRDPWQQARFLLLRVLADRATTAPQPDHADVA